MLQTKALYNLLRLNAAEDPSVKAEPWALEDFRALSDEQIYSRLKKGNIQIDPESFLRFADECDTPEELADLLFEEENPQWDENYLLIFELWRRHLLDKQSLSIFCDELDYRISLYDHGDLENDELIQDGLANLLEVLDENADTGADPQETFASICDYCAHDLESFLYDYIADLLDSGNQFYASELIDGFHSYVQESIWFDFLKARLLSFTDIGESNLMIHRILDNEETDDPLLMEILHHLSIVGEHELFTLAVNKILPHLKTDKELLDVMSIVADYYRRLDEDTLEQAIQKLMQKRKESHRKLDSKDPDLKILSDLLTKL